MKQSLQKDKPDEHQRHADHAAGDQRRIHRRFGLFVFARAEHLRRYHRAADIAPERHRDEQQCHLIAVAHGGERLFADELARHQAVGDIVKLLKDDAAEKWQAEFPQHAAWLSDGQIPIHAKHLDFFFSCATLYCLTVAGEKCIVEMACISI